MKKNNLEYSIAHHNLSKNQKAKADEELRKMRFESLSEMKEQQKMYSDLLSLKFKMIDYVDNNVLSEKFLFSAFLKKYVSTLNTSSRKLAQDLNIHETKFSRLINNKENPGIALLYRIEEHSNNLIPATLLWQIVNLKLIVDIQNNKSERKKQSKKVKNKLNLKSI